MGWLDVSSRAAIIAAIEEYDRLGADAFLTRFGYHQAREYHLYYNGKFYPSKAIYGVAHRYQFPEQGPLDSDEFSGGAATVKPRLELMGFIVIVGSMVDIRLELYKDYSREQVHHIFKVLNNKTLNSIATYNPGRTSIFPSHNFIPSIR